jgi:hypothetical protein
MTTMKQAQRMLAVDDEVNKSKSSFAGHRRRCRCGSPGVSLAINSEADEQSPGVSLAIDANVDEEKSSTEAGRR